MSFLNNFFGPPNVEKLKNNHNVRGLIKALRYKKDDNVRQVAAEILGEFCETSAVEPLISALLDDKNQHVRNAAAKSLVKIGAPSIEPLITILKKVFWSRVLDTLERIDPDWSKSDIARTTIHSLITGLGSGETIKALINIGQPAVKPLIDALQQGDRVEIGARDALVGIGEPAFHALINVLNNDEASTRTKAVYALAFFKGMQAIEPIIIKLQKDIDSDVRRSAALALGIIGNKKALEPLISTLYKDRAIGVRRASVNALSRIGDKRAIDPLIVALKDSEIQTDVIQALATFGEVAVESLIGALQDNNADVRIGAVKSLREIRDPRAIEPLITALKDSHFTVRTLAKATLEKIGDAKTLKPFLEAHKVQELMFCILGDAYWESKIEAIRALANMGGEDAKSAIRRALYDKNEFVRAVAYTELPKLWTAEEHEGAAMNTQGLSFIRQGHYEEALVCLNKALQVFPDDDAILSNKGIVLNELKRYDEAIQFIDRAIKLRPLAPAPEDVNNKGNALLGLGHYKEALECYEEAIRLRGLGELAVVPSLRGKAEALAGLGRFAEAVEALNNLLRIKPDAQTAIQKKAEYTRKLYGYKT